MTSQHYILSIDQGTTSSRAIIYDQDHHVIAVEQYEFPQHFPHSGWVEHDVEDIWSSVLKACKAVLAKSQLDAKSIAGIGISNQRETTVVWEKATGKAIFPAIVWQDRRTADFCEALKGQGITDWLQQKTGLLPDPYFSASKIAWILDHVEGARAKAENGDLCFGTIESFLVWRLTGGKVHVSDVTNASRTLLMNITTRQWDDELLKIFDVPKNLLPRIVSNAEKYGETDPSLFGSAIPITGMAGDQQAALVGEACIETGMLKTTLGTGAFLVLNTGPAIIYSKHQLLTTLAYEIHGTPSYALEGSIFNAGTLMKWIKEELGLIQDYAEVEDLVKATKNNAGVYFVPAFTGLGAPYWNPDVRGILTGLTRASGKAHIVRAALEAIAYQLQDIGLAMSQDMQSNIKEMRVDGGLTKSQWLLQFIANMLNVPVLKTASQEASCYGASLLAQVGAGLYPNLEAATQNWHAVRKFLPLMDEAKRSALYQGWLRAVSQCMA